MSGATSVDLSVVAIVRSTMETSGEMRSQGRISAEKNKGCRGGAREFESPEATPIFPSLLPHVLACAGIMLIVSTRDASCPP